MSIWHGGRGGGGGGRKRREKKKDSKGESIGNLLTVMRISVGDGFRIRAHVSFLV